MKKSMKSKIKTNKVLQAGMGYTIGNYLLKGINLITLPIFARLMNKTDYGLFNIYMSYEGIFVILIGVTLHSSLKNARYEFKNDYRKYVSSIEIVPMIMLAVALLIVNLFSGSVTQVTGLNLLTLDLLMIHSYCSALLQFYNADLSIDYKYTSFLKIAFFNTIANVLISLILMTTVLSSKRYAARIAGCVAPLVLICVYILFKLFSSEKPKYNKTFWKFGVKYSLPIVPHGLSQIVLSQFDKELFELAQAKGCILMEAIKTAYNTAFSRLVLLAKSGKIGDIVSVDATCTSLKELAANEVEKLTVWNSAFDWGPTAMLPVFEILGTNYKLKRIVTHYIDKERNFDDFTKMDFTYDNAVASIKVGMGVKSEGELIVSGTKGYIYVPAPWWKTDYFELRYENAADNRRYFYQLDGEGIRYELVAFVRAIDNGRMARYIEEYVSEAISSIVSDFHNGIDVIAIKN